VGIRQGVAGKPVGGDPDTFHQEINEKNNGRQSQEKTVLLLEIKAIIRGIEPKFPTYGDHKQHTTEPPGKPNHWHSNVQESNARILRSASARSKMPMFPLKASQQTS
jgi:hypothetical protein